MRWLRALGPVLAGAHAGMGNTFFTSRSRSPSRSICLVVSNIIVLVVICILDFFGTLHTGSGTGSGLCSHRYRKY